MATTMTRRQASLPSNLHGSLRDSSQQAAAAAYARAALETDEAGERTKPKADANKRALNQLQQITCNKLLAVAFFAAPLAAACSAKVVLQHRNISRTRTVTVDPAFPAHFPIVVYVLAR